MMEFSHIDKLTNIPLSADQRRLWIIYQQDKSNPAYNLELTYHLRGEINIELFKKSLDILFKKHYVLFSVFKSKEGIPFIDISQRPVKVELVDFSGKPRKIRNDEILEFAGQDSRKPFNIESGPLYRLYLLKQDETSYYFHATIHHLIFDGWSMRLFMLELQKFYYNLIQKIEIKQESIKYGYDIANKEGKREKNENIKKLIDFWKKTLNNCTPVLNFPFDFPRKKHSTGFGEKVPVIINKNLTGKLEELTEFADTSMFKIMLSLLGVFLNKYTKESDICIGFPISKRRGNPLLSELIGMFVNTSLARLKIKEKNTILENILYGKDVITKAIENSNIPFNRIVEIINPDRISNINPLFQVALSWWDGVTVPVEMSGIKGERIHVSKGVSPFDITFYLWNEGNQIVGEIEYNIDIISRETIIRLKDNFLHLLESVVTDPNQIVQNVSVISEKDQQKLAVINDTEAFFPDELLQSSFENQAIINPSKISVVSGDNKLTYKELNIQSNKLANYLLSEGVIPGAVIGVCIHRSVDMVIALLAVLKAGACYLPIDPTFPEDRIYFMIQDSNARLLISDHFLKVTSNITIVNIESEKDDINQYKKDKPELNLNNLAPAYIIYTSGSTGNPKGVRIRHKSVVNLIESMSKMPGIKEKDILLAVVTLSFDMSVFELFVPLSKGATVVVASSENATNGQLIIDLIERHNITLIQATPAFWNILLASGWQGKKTLKALCGGEELTPRLVREILPKVGEFWNCYGPTEATVYATCKHITDADATIVIGKPIHNTAIQILDKNNKPVPLGVYGEVAIEGIGLAIDYYNQSELTKNKFIHLEDGKRIYKTGDNGRFRSNGDVELLGRLDNQIKIRGFRIEPGEIEYLLNSLPQIKESVVKITQFNENDKRLVAFLNTDPSFNMTIKDIEKFLSKKLPQYQVPSFFQIMDHFPRLPNGKLDKNSLIINFNKKRVNDQKGYNYGGRLTNTQKILFLIWQDALKINDFDITDNFFDVGGHSLLAVSVFSKIKTAFQIELELKVFFESPRIEDLANAIEIYKMGKAHKDADGKKDNDGLNIIRGEL